MNEYNKTQNKLDIEIKSPTCVIASHRSSFISASVTATVFKFFITYLNRTKWMFLEK